jgi:DNA-binding transcriptional LysR family regulator
MLDFRIETFLEVCRTLNYTRAAENLNLTQPAVSQHIRFIEDRYHSKLLVYHSKKLSLTPAGEMLRALAITMTHDDEELKERMAQLESDERSLDIGVTRTAGEYVLAPALAAYLNIHPQSRLSVIEDDTQALLGELDRGGIDCALVEGLFDKSAYDWEVFSHEPFVCVCAIDHVSTEEPRGLEDVLGERLIVREEGSGTRAVLEHLLEGENLLLTDFPHRCTVTSLNIIKQFVAADCGITFLYRAAVADVLSAGLLREVSLSNVDYEHDFTFVWRKKSAYANDYQKLFKELMSYR